MIERMQWIPIAVALLAGFGGGFMSSEMTATVAAPDEQDVCRIAVEHIESLDRRLASADGASHASDSHARMARPITRVGSSSTTRSIENGSETLVSEELRRLGSQMDELLAASLCRSPEALAQAEDEAKLDRRDNAAAVEDTQRIVENARNRGRWTDADAAELREMLPLLTRQQQDEILAVLIPALQGELEVDSFPPF